MNINELCDNLRMNNSVQLCVLLRVTL